MLWNNEETPSDADDTLKIISKQTRHSPVSVGLTALAWRQLADRNVRQWAYLVLFISDGR